MTKTYLTTFYAPQGGWAVDAAYHEALPAGDGTLFLRLKLADPMETIFDPLPEALRYLEPLYHVSRLWVGRNTERDFRSRTQAANWLMLVHDVEPLDVHPAAWRALTLEEAEREG